MAEEFLNVSERFFSLQGESTWAGLPCCFIRLAGCNLRCSYCDSRYTWEEDGKETSLLEILAWIDTYPGIMVELTGGEPLLQESTYPLIKAILNQERTVLIETNGSVSVEHVPSGAHIILDIKCPGSGMENMTKWENIHLLRSRAEAGCHDEIKFVLSSQEDFFWAKKIVEQHDLLTIGSILFSPNTAMLSARELAELILQNRLQVRMQLQLHRVIWPDIDRGV